MQNKLIQLDSLIADCTSGVSGAGRQASMGTQYCEVNEGLRAYKVAEHRHNPEMEQELSLLAGEPVLVTFSPHLAPLSRGILGTLYARLLRPLDEVEILNFYQNFYEGQPFIRLLPQGSLPDTRNVRGSNYCDLGVRVDAPGAGHCGGGHRQPAPGGRRPGGAQLQPDGRVSRDHGPGFGAIDPLKARVKRGKG